MSMALERKIPKWIKELTYSFKDMLNETCYDKGWISPSLRLIANFSSVVIIPYYFVVDIKSRMCSATYIVLLIFDSWCY